MLDPHPLYHPIRLDRGMDVSRSKNTVTPKLREAAHTIDVSATSHSRCDTRNNISTRQPCYEALVVSPSRERWRQSIRARSTPDIDVVCELQLDERAAGEGVPVDEAVGLPWLPIDLHALSTIRQYFSCSRRGCEVDPPEQIRAHRCHSSGCHGSHSRESSSSS